MNINSIFSPSSFSGDCEVGLKILSLTMAWFFLESASTQVPTQSHLIRTKGVPSALAI